MEGVAERLKAWNSPTYARTPLAPGPLSPQSSGSVPRPPTPPLSRSRSGVCLRRSSDGSAKSPSWFRPILTLQCGRGDRGGGRNASRLTAVRKGARSPAGAQAGGRGLWGVRHKSGARVCREEAEAGLSSSSSSQLTSSSLQREDGASVQQVYHLMN